MPRTEKVERHLEYRFTSDEHLKLGQELANAYFDHEQIETQFNSIKADYKGRLMAVETIIQQATRKIRDGFDMRPVECEVRFHEPEQGWKRIVRLDTLAEVAVERMLPHEKQEILPFVEPEEEPVEAAAAAAAEQPAAAEEVDNFPPAWPAANENGVFEDESRAIELKWEMPGGKQFAIIRYLELEDGWIGAIRVSLGATGYFGPLSETSQRHETEGAVIADQLAQLERWVESNNEGDSKSAKKAAQALKAWIDAMLEEYEPKDSYPVPDANGFYDDSNALRLRKDLGNDDYVEFRLLEIDKDSWLGLVDIKVGGFERINEELTNRFHEPDQKATVIWSLGVEVENLLSAYAAEHKLKGQKLLNIQGAITAVRAYARRLEEGKEQ